MDSTTAPDGDEVEDFLSACRGARVVATARGPAIVAGGALIEITSAAPDVHATAIAILLAAAGQKIANSKCQTRAA